MSGINYTKQPAPPAGKITLTKTRPGISLIKQAGQLRVNLNWDARPAQPAPGGGLFKRLAARRGIDLDLGCLYELADGRKGVVQALGDSFGSLEQAPYIWLSGDDRSGDNTTGETLFVNLAHATQPRRVLVFACIYDGATSFAQANAVVTLTPAVGPEIEVRLDGHGGRSRICAIAQLTAGTDGLSANREIRYIDGAQRALDHAYGWGMNWTPGRK